MATRIYALLSSSLIRSYRSSCTRHTLFGSSTSYRANRALAYSMGGRLSLCWSYVISPSSLEGLRQVIDKTLSPVSRHPTRTWPHHSRSSSPHLRSQALRHVPQLFLATGAPRTTVHYYCHLRTTGSAHSRQSRSGIPYHRPACPVLHHHVQRDIHRHVVVDPQWARCRQQGRL